MRKLKLKLDDIAQYVEKTCEDAQAAMQEERAKRMRAESDRDIHKRRIEELEKMTMDQEGALIRCFGVGALLGLVVSSILWSLFVFVVF